MRTFPLQKTKGVLTTLVILLFVGYYVNCTMFWHSHIINGVLITHSHFYGVEHTASEDGGHSMLQIHAIEMLTNITAVGTTILAVAGAVMILEAVIREPQFTSPIHITISHKALRAPPARF